MVSLPRANQLANSIFCHTNFDNHRPLGSTQTLGLGPVRWSPSMQPAEDNQVLVQLRSDISASVHQRGKLDQCTSMLR